MGSDLIVRPLRYEGKDSRAFSDYLGGERYELGRTDIGSFAHFLAQLLQSSRIFVAEQGKEMVGFVSLTRGDGPAEHAGTIRLHVSKKARGSGIGTQLVQAVLKWADENGVERVVATPYVKRITSCPITGGPSKVAFFEKHGFELEGLARKFARLHDGTFTDAALMARVRY